MRGAFLLLLHLLENCLIVSGRENNRGSHICVLVWESASAVAKVGIKAALPADQLAQNKRDYSGNAHSKLHGSFFLKVIKLFLLLARTGLQIIHLSLQCGKMFLLSSVRFKQCTHVISLFLLGGFGPLWHIKSDIIHLVSFNLNQFQIN